MLYTEWNMEDACRVAKEEAMEQGFAQGLEQGMAKGIEQGIEKGIEQGIERGIERGIEQGRNEGVRETILAFKGLIAPEVVAETLKLPLAEVLRILEPEAEGAERASTLP